MEQNIVTASKPIKIPGPDHPITIERNPARIVVSVAGADRRRRTRSFDAPRSGLSRRPVHPAQGRRGLLDRTDRATYCPYKGDCSYFSIPLGGERSINAVWSFEAPYAAVMPIKDYLAFYPERVDAIEERPEA